jgi:hypothetical protein
VKGVACHPANTSWTKDSGKYIVAHNKYIQEKDHCVVDVGTVRQKDKRL